MPARAYKGIPKHGKRCFITKNADNSEYITFQELEDDQIRVIKGRGPIFLDVSYIRDALRKLGWVPPDLVDEAEQLKQELNELQDQITQLNYFKDTVLAAVGDFFKPEIREIERVKTIVRPPTEIEIAEFAARGGPVAGSTEEWRSLYPDIPPEEQFVTMITHYDPEPATPIDSPLVTTVSAEEYDALEAELYAETADDAEKASAKKGA